MVKQATSATLSLQDQVHLLVDAVNTFKLSAQSA